MVLNVKAAATFSQIRRGSAVFRMAVASATTCSKIVQRRNPKSCFETVRDKKSLVSKKLLPLVGAPLRSFPEDMDESLDEEEVENARATAYRISRLLLNGAADRKESQEACSQSFKIFPLVPPKFVAFDVFSRMAMDALRFKIPN